MAKTRKTDVEKSSPKMSADIDIINADLYDQLQSHARVNKIYSQSTYCLHRHHLLTFIFIKKTQCSFLAVTLH